MECCNFPFASERNPPPPLCNITRKKVIKKTATKIFTTALSFVARPRIELGTSWLWIMRSNQLSYRAITNIGYRFPFLRVQRYYFLRNLQNFCCIFSTKVHFFVIYLFLLHNMGVKNDKTNVNTLWLEHSFYCATKMHYTQTKLLTIRNGAVTFLYG